MVLSGQTIRLLNKSAALPLIDPFHERTVQNGMSFGLSCAGYDLRIKAGRVLQPGDFFLATTIERLSFLDDIMGQLVDKSTWARRGVAVQNTVFEPGWRGYPTLEVSNHGKDVVTIPDGSPIAQMLFLKVDQIVERPYNGKYQDQIQKPIGAIDEI